MIKKQQCQEQFLLFCLTNIKSISIKSNNLFVVVAQLVEHFLGKEEVVGSSPVNSTIFY